MRYKAVIFDLDGTLLDTIKDIADSFNHVLEKHNYATFAEEDYKYFVGMGIDILVQKIIAASNLPATDFEVLKKEYYNTYNANQANNTKPYHGITSLLKQLNDKNISINVLSNKPHSQALSVVKHYFPDIKFEYIYGKKTDFPIKPDPKSVNEIIGSLKLEHSEILYIGDTVTDMETAKNAGLTSVGVLWGFRKEAELVSAGADFIVEEPMQILGILEGDKDDFKQS